MLNIWRIDQVIMLTTIVIIVLLALFFVGMTFTGLFRFRKTSSWWLVVCVFTGLAIVSFTGPWVVLSILGRTMGRDPSFDRYFNWYHPIEIIFAIVPALLFAVMAFIGSFGYRRGNSGILIKTGIIGAVIALLFSLFILNSIGGNPIIFLEARTKSNALLINNALQRYAADMGGFYPDNIGSLIGDNYLTTMPDNLFTGQPMKNVAYNSPDSVGNVTYLPLKVEDQIQGYYFLIYGYTTSPGRQLLSSETQDHVFLVVTENSLWPESVTFPTVQEAILASQE
jgi:hypothetical protein